MRYKIIKTTCRAANLQAEAQRLEAAVSRRLEDGWQLSGGVAVNSFGETVQLMQAMIKESDDDD
jgi:hypothetical protein